MTTFRKKPVVIEAVQWFKPGDHPMVRLDNPNGPWIDTLEGGHIVTPGDWIITGVKGEHYPCKPDIFALTYEPAYLAQPAGEPLFTGLIAQHEGLAEELAAMDKPAGCDGCGEVCRRAGLCAACGAELSKPAGEPVAWRRYCPTGGWEYEDGITSFASDPSANALYLHPAQPQGEPVAWMGARKNLYRTRSLALSNREQFVQPLYTHPAHTEEEVRELLTKISGFKAGEYGYAALETTLRRILGVPAP